MSRLPSLSLEAISEALKKERSIAGAARELGRSRSTVASRVSNSQELTKLWEVIQAEDAAEMLEATKLTENAELTNEGGIVTRTIRTSGSLNEHDLRDPKQLLIDLAIDPEKFQIGKVQAKKADAGTSKEPRVDYSLAVTVEPIPEPPLQPGISKAQVTIKAAKPRRRPKRSQLLSIVAGDFHFPFVNRIMLEHFLDMCRTERPDRVILNGDVLNGSQASRHGFKLLDEIALPSLQDEVDMVTEFGFKLRAHVGDECEIVLNPGNHDEWLQRYDVQNAPATAALTPGKLPDEERQDALHSLRRYLRTDEWGCSITDAYPHGFVTINNRLRIVHGKAVRKNSGTSPHATMERTDHATINSHTHRLAIVSRTVTQADGRRYSVQGGEAGCMCDLSVLYDSEPDWQNGWLVINHEEGSDHYSLEAAVHQNGVTLWRDRRWEG